MSGNRSNRRRQTAFKSVIVVLALVLVLAFVIGVAFYAVNGGLGGSESSSSDIISSDEPISSEDPISSDEPTSSEDPVSSEKPVSSEESVSSTTPTPQPTNKKVCYLTFDDGPSANTTKILDILKENNAKATFFVVGSSVRSGENYKILQRIVNEGHTIALHANVHTYEKIYASEEAYFNDLNTISDLVYNWTGKRADIIRFPGGSSNMVSKFNPGIMTRLTQMVIEKGYQYFDWNVDSNDAGGYCLPAADLVNNIKTNYYVNHGLPVCVLMHDTAVKKTTPEALPEMIEYMKEKGYTFEALDKSVTGFKHKVNN